MVTRDVHSLEIEKWAETTDAADIGPPSSAGLTQSGGYDSSYKTPGGNNPEMEVIQWLWRAWSGMLVELNAHGLLVWNAGLSYVHPALVFGSDGLAYASVRNSMGVDPTTDTNDSDWTLLVVVGANTFDASAITSGVIDVSHIPNLNASKINAGTLGTGRIPNLSANKITSGNLGVNRIPNLDASKVTSGIFDVARIPGGGLGLTFDASAIVSGIMALARMPNLPASQITSGILALARIPVSSLTLDASQVSTGVLAAIQIPNLNANKITSGTLGTARIPDLNASKINAGTLGVNRIPTLPLSRVTGAAPLVSPAMTGNPTVPTQGANNNSTRSASTAFVQTVAANLVASAPGTLDTLNELAAALGDDPNFATTVTNLVNSFAVSVVQPGTLIDFAGMSAPTGYLICDGSAVSRSTYSDLFTAIGTDWGSGNGSSTFNVPDLRRRVTAGAGGTMIDGPGTSVGNTGGEEQHDLSAAEMPDHTHVMSVTGHSDNNHQLQTNTRFATEERPGFGTGTRATGSTGGGDPHNNMQPTAIVNKIIKT